MQDRIPKILLTGRPGCGKTTVIMKLADCLSDKNIAGFYSREVRRAGQRSGFSIQTFGGGEGLLSSVDLKQGPQVGRYRVDVSGFEKLVLPEMLECADWADAVLIDEIGKMECFSKHFIQAMEKLLLGDRPLVATVAQKGTGFINTIKKRSDISLIEVTPTNRNQLPEQIAAQLFNPET